MDVTIDRVAWKLPGFQDPLVCIVVSWAWYSCKASLLKSDLVLHSHALSRYDRLYVDLTQLCRIAIMTPLILAGTIKSQSEVVAGWLHFDSGVRAVHAWATRNLQSRWAANVRLKKRSGGKSMFRHETYKFLVFARKTWQKCCVYLFCSVVVILSLYLVILTGQWLRLAAKGATVAYIYQPKKSKVLLVEQTRSLFGFTLDLAIHALGFSKC